MADVKISALTATTLPLAGTEEIPINDSGTTMMLTVAQLLTNPVIASYMEWDAISDPAAPAAGVIRVYAKSVAGRILPKWKGPSGIDTQFQAALDGNSVVMWLPGTGTTAAINFGVNWSIGATQAHPTIASTSVMTSIKRATYTTTTTAGNASGVYSGAPVAMISGTANMGGFFYAARFGVLTFSSTMQILVGLSAQSTILAGQPSAIANTIAATKDSTDANWQVTAVSSGAVAAKTDSGHAVAAAGAAEIFDLYMFAKPGDSTTVTVRLVDAITETVYIDNVTKTTDLPASGVALFAHAVCRNSAGGSGSAVAMFLSKIYIECDN